LGYWQIFTEPTEPVQYSNPVQAMELPINLGPRAGAGGYLIFELPDYLRAGLASSPHDEFVVEIHEALSGKMATFPAMAVGGTFRRRRGLIPTTFAERVYGPKPPAAWYRVMGGPDRAYDLMSPPDLKSD
jgi:hypothetical protein